MNQSTAEDIIRQFERTHPQVVRLAELLAPAVRIEGALIRRIRLEALPYLSADAEATLWFSPLVQSHSAAGLTLSVPAAVVLRGRLSGLWHSEKRPQLERVRAIYAAVHDYLAPPLRLEEEVAWDVVVGDIDSANRRLDTAVAALLAEPERFRFWVDGAMTRLPDLSRSKGSAALLARAATGEEPTGRLWEAAYDTLGTKALTVRHMGSLLELSGPIFPGTRRIQVPDTSSVVLALSWQASGGTVTEQVVLDKRERAAALVSVTGPVEVRTAAGTTYLVRDHPFARPSRIEPATDPRGELLSMVEFGSVPGVRLTDTGERPELGIELRNGTVVLVGESGEPLPNVPQLSLQSESLASRLATLAAHVSRWLTVSELRSGSPVLDGAIAVGVVSPEQGFPTESGVPSSDLPVAIITNRSNEPLFTAAFAISSNWSVQALTEGKISPILEPGGQWQGGLSDDLVDPGQEEAFVRIIGVAARRAFDPTALELPPISQAGREPLHIAPPQSSFLDAEFARMIGGLSEMTLEPYLEWTTDEAEVTVRVPSKEEERTRLRPEALQEESPEATLPAEDHNLFAAEEASRSGAPWWQAPRLEDPSTATSYIFSLLQRNIATAGFTIPDHNAPGSFALPGCVLASPSWSGYPGNVAPVSGDYVFNWTRDAALTVSAILRQAPELVPVAVATQILANYVDFANTCQEAGGVIGQAKYTPEAGPTGAPDESDGPALRVLTLLQGFSSLSQVSQLTARKVIATDLNYILSGNRYQQPTVTHWEDTFGQSIFARSVQLRCLNQIISLGPTLSIPVPPSAYSATNWLAQQLPLHWSGGTNNFYVSVLDGVRLFGDAAAPYDPSIDPILAFLHGDAISPIDPKLLATAARVRAQWSAGELRTLPCQR